jgi:hypothetical protein
MGFLMHTLTPFFTKRQIEKNNPDVWPSDRAVLSSTPRFGIFLNIFFGIFFC